MDTSQAPPSGAATPRLMIEKMVLENFKSYGGEREVRPPPFSRRRARRRRCPPRAQIGPFHKKFSSIVGPNGSGKSNVRRRRPGKRRARRGGRRGGAGARATRRAA